MDSLGNSVQNGRTNAFTERKARLWSDDTLARKVTDDDSLAFSEMYRRFHQPVYRYCRSILGNEEDARDGLQNTMTKAMKSLPGEKRDLELKAWLFRVARNECLDTIRARRTTVDVTEHEIDGNVDVAASAASRAQLRQLLVDIDQLPERQRSALVMRELNDLSFEDIAGALGTTPAVSRQTVYEARLALQDLENGRMTPCSEVMGAVSAGDRRVLKGRGLRAHLRGCVTCRAFSEDIDNRALAFRSFIPGLTPVAAGSIFGALAGSTGSGGAGGLIGALNSAGAVGFGVKAAAVVVATASIGAGAVGVAREVQNQGSPGPAATVVASDHSAPERSIGTPRTRGSKRPGTPTSAEPNSRKTRKGEFDKSVTGDPGAMEASDVPPDSGSGTPETDPAPSEASIPERRAYKSPPGLPAGLPSVPQVDLPDSPVKVPDLQLPANLPVKPDLGSVVERVGVRSGK